MSDDHPLSTMFFCARRKKVERAFEYESESSRSFAEREQENDNDNEREQISLRNTQSAQQDGG
jgi:hypothetical protein